MTNTPQQPPYQAPQQRPTTTPAPIATPLPTCFDMEQALLGAMMQHRDTAQVVSELLRPEILYTESHQLIYATIIALLQERAPVDLMVVYERLSREGKLEQVGGAYYLSGLTTEAHRVTNPTYYALVILEKYFYRESYLRLTRLAEAALHQAEGVDQLNCSIAREVNFLANLTADGEREVSWAQAIEQSMEDYARRCLLAKQDKIAGLASGIVDLDALTGGFQPGENIIICARPSMGKTAFALHLAQRMAGDGHPVVIFSLEMMALQLTNRALLGSAEVHPLYFKQGTLSPLEEQELIAGAEAIRHLPITINDNPTTSLMQIHARCAALKRDGRCEVLFVDYLQLVGSVGERRHRNREQEVAEVSRAAKMLALDLKITVVLLSQLNRQSEARVDKRPQLHDLRDSGAIEQDADMVIAIHREEYYDPTPEKRGKGEALVLKNRNGATGSAKFGYNSSMTRIY